jgi:hypothetical protein
MIPQATYRWKARIDEKILAQQKLAVDSAALLCDSFQRCRTSAVNSMQIGLK